eukprot:763574-Hanusia_phi.AAC.7
MMPLWPRGAIPMEICESLTYSSVTSQYLRVPGRIDIVPWACMHPPLVFFASTVDPSSKFRMSAMLLARVRSARSVSEYKRQIATTFTPELSLAPRTSPGSEISRYRSSIRMKGRPKEMSDSSYQDCSSFLPASLSPRRLLLALLLVFLSSLLLALLPAQSLSSALLSSPISAPRMVKKIEPDPEKIRKKRGSFITPTHPHVELSIATRGQRGMGKQWEGRGGEIAIMIHFCRNNKQIHFAPLLTVFESKQTCQNGVLVCSDAWIFKQTVRSICLLSDSKEDG